MASERTLRAVAAQGVVLLAGGAAAWAAAGGLYASALTAALAGAWLAAVQVEEARGVRVRLGRGRSEAASLETPLLRALLNEAPAPLLLLEPGGAVRAVNRAARTLFETEDRVHRPPAQLLQALREDAAGGRRRLALSGGAGPRRLYALSLADVGAVGGTVRLGALLDVQAEVHAAEADTLRRVLQVMSHELMNALTPVTSLAETASDLLAAEPSSAAADARAALATIARRADGLARFVEGYRAAARLPEPRPRATDLAQLVEDAVRLACARPDAASVPIVLNRPAAPLVRVTDPELAVQALANLLANAVEAAAAASSGAQVRVTLAPTASGAHIEVADTGPGVPGGEAESIFMPLTTSKPRGSGVGLHLARAAMRSLGGDVLLVAAGGPGEPTRFRIVL